jgi:hypothetical protein
VGFVKYFEGCVAILLLLHTLLAVVFWIIVHIFYLHAFIVSDAAYGEKTKTNWLFIIDLFGNICTLGSYYLFSTEQIG